MNQSRVGTGELKLTQIPPSTTETASYQIEEFDTENNLVGWTNLSIEDSGTRRKISAQGQDTNIVFTHSKETGLSISIASPLEMIDRLSDRNTHARVKRYPTMSVVMAILPNGKPELAVSILDEDDLAPKDYILFPKSSSPSRDKEGEVEDAVVLAFLLLKDIITYPVGYAQGNSKLLNETRNFMREQVNSLLNLIENEENKEK